MAYLEFHNGDLKRVCFKSRHDKCNEVDGTRTKRFTYQ